MHPLYLQTSKQDISLKGDIKILHKGKTGFYNIEVLQSNLGKQFGIC